MQDYGANKVVVRTGLIRTPVREDAPVVTAIVGVAPPDHGWLTELLPQQTVRSTRYGNRDAAIEHLRFTPGQLLDALPGLDGRQPSGVRDAVALALAAGAPYADLILARAHDANPWDLDREDVRDILVPYLSTLPQAQFALPDAAGPAATALSAPIEPREACERLLRVARSLQDCLREHFQIAYLDYPRGGEDLLREFIQRLGSTDAALCMWAGDDRALRRHGWRSAGAALAGLQFRPNTEPTAGTSGQTIHLGAGRYIRPTRHDVLLNQPAPRRHQDAAEYLIELAVQSDGASALVRGEPTLRRPVGEWNLAALRTLKAIHHRIRFAAERYVFRPVDQAEAFGLQSSLETVLQPFIAGGVMVGPNGVGQPLFAAQPVVDRAAPSLVADIAAQVRPWCQDVRVRVAVDPGQGAEVNITTT